MEQRRKAKRQASPPERLLAVFGTIMLVMSQRYHSVGYRI